MTELEHAGAQPATGNSGVKADDLLERVREAVERTREVIAATRETLGQPAEGGKDAQAGGD